MTRRKVIMLTHARLVHLTKQMQIDCADLVTKKDVMMFQAVQFQLRGLIKILEAML